MIGGKCMTDKRQLSYDEIVSGFHDALDNGQIYVCYQAQINHMTKSMTGAEALMRWDDPEHGPQYPSDFIPHLERADLIFQADLFVFRQVCMLQRYCLDNGIKPVPLSVNMSRYDIYNNNKYVEKIEEIRKEYDLPVELLRIEITESSAIGGSELIQSVLRQLHDAGYIVEMDDFGAGYSSLNILKDLDIDVIKLDMAFLGGEIGGRGGTIISSVIQMTKWLNTPVIAEGVETRDQADYMKSIGCYNIQGYLYSKPVKREAFLELCRKEEHEPEKPATGLFDDIGSGKFWNPDSMETLLFNNFVGPAAIFAYTRGRTNGRIEILRVNAKYVKELGMNVTEKNVLEGMPLEGMDARNRAIYEATIMRAISSREEEECENWRYFYSDCCGQDRVCIRSSMRLIGEADMQFLFYVNIRNITAEKLHYESLKENEKKLSVAFDQTNSFAWEYDVRTKEMRPCARCRRELGLPEVIENYPEPLIENGFFPADIADMYRRWHKELADGADHFEARLPLTQDRIPFMVRYTAEYDEGGRPYKAYGSATEIREEKT